VSFAPIGSNRTRVSLDLDVEPDGALEAIGDALGLVERRVHDDLQRFKAFIESRGAPTGAWRGAVDDGRVTDRGDR
jgi:uncharacterized membrane protein